MPHRSETLAKKMPPPIQAGRILIVDDSVVARAVIARMIDAGDRFQVAGAVSDASAAIAFLKLNQVDLILLDIEMPGIDGLTALPQILAAGRGARVLIVSSSCAEGASATIQALALGAADTLVKPGIGNLVGKFSDALEEKITRLLVRDDSAAISSPSRAQRVVVGNDFDIVAIGASTGGIHALSQLLRELPITFKLPILVTQHLPASFMPYFAAQLAVLSGRTCAVGTEHMRIEPGKIIVAPGEAHLRCVRYGDQVTVRLSAEKSASGCMPSVDPMLESVAAVYGSRALAVILSGMGRDGCDGARMIGKAGGSVVAQDKASSVVWGMPGAVASAGLADAVMPPADLGRLVAAQRRPG